MDNVSSNRFVVSLFTWLSLSCLSNGCLPIDPGPQTRFTELELKSVDSNTSLPSDVSVLVERVGGRATIAPKIETQISPPDQFGRIIFPFTFSSFWRSTFDGDLRISLHWGGGSDMLTVSNNNGATDRSSLYVVTILTTNAPPPPRPSFVIDFGSKPPRIQLHGYLAFLDICDNSTDQFIWRISSTSGYAYVDVLDIGTVKDAFAIFDNGLTNCRLASRFDIVPSSGFTVIGDVADVGYGVLGQYCLDGDGAALECNSK